VKIKVLLIASLLPAWGCAWTQSSTATVNPMVNEEPLDDAALQSIFSDVFVTADPPVPAGAIVSHPRGEIFLSNGVYLRQNGRTRSEGSFRIRNSLICVQMPSLSERCRKVLRGPGLLYRFSDPADGSSGLLFVNPLASYRS